MKNSPLFYSLAAVGFIVSIAAIFVMIKIH